MKKWTIGQRVMAVSVCLIALVFCAGFVGMLGMSRIKAAADGVSSTYIANLDRFSQIEHLTFELRGHVFLAALSHEAPDLRNQTLNRADQIQGEIDRLFAELNRPDSITSGERAIFNDFRDKQRAYVVIINKFRELESTGKLDEAKALVAQHCLPGRIALQQAYAKEAEYNRRGLVTCLERITALSSWFSAVACAVFLIALIAGVAATVLTVRSITAALRASTDRIRASAEEVNSAASQVAAASESVAQGASQQAASLEETSASGQEITAMTQRTAESSQAAAKLMAEAGVLVSSANTKVAHLVTSMGEISNSSERIAKIIKVIDEIAFQTNILALNAAVEAARAGEAGLGFAVVADEVRNLAQRCAQAAKDTTALIEESVQNARTGSNHIVEVAAAMRDITESASKVKLLVDEIEHGGAEQARGIEQISRALVQIESTTQQTAAGAEESASASQQLRSQVESMRSIVLALESLSSNKGRSLEPVARPVSVPRVRSSKKPELSSSHTLLPLQKAVGTRRPAPKMSAVTTPVVVPAMAADRHAFPLDDSEFREF
jgi:methyl-accepting chemotaxis protein